MVKKALVVSLIASSILSANKQEINVGWNLLSVPVDYKLQNWDVTSPQTYSGDYFSMYSFSAVWSFVDGKWEQTPDTIEMGQGFWLNSKKAMSVDLTSTYNTEIPNELGWHLLGAGRDMSVTDSGLTVWTFGSSGWSKNPSTIKQGQGFWVNVGEVSGYEMSMLFVTDREYPFDVTLRVGNSDETLLTALSFEYSDGKPVGVKNLSIANGDKWSSFAVDSDGNPQSMIDSDGNKIYFEFSGDSYSFKLIRDGVVISSGNIDKSSVRVFKRGLVKIFKKLITGDYREINGEDIISGVMDVTNAIACVGSGGSATFACIGLGSSVVSDGVDIVDEIVNIENKDAIKFTAYTASNLKSITNCVPPNSGKCLVGLTKQFGSDIVGLGASALTLGDAVDYMKENDLSLGTNALFTEEKSDFEIQNDLEKVVQENTTNTSVKDTDDHSNSIDGATTLSSSQNGELEESGDIDYFKIVLDEAGTLVLYSTGSTDTMGYLYDSNGGSITSNDDGDDSNFKISYETEAGTYYLAVSGYESETGEYKLYKEFIEKESSMCLTQAGEEETTPMQYTINLGNDSGIIEFEYETFIEEDEFIIEYPDGSSKKVWSSGVVGTDGWKSVELSYSGGDEATLIVKPNRESTKWKFKLYNSCIVDSQELGDDYYITSVSLKEQESVFEHKRS